MPRTERHRSTLRQAPFGELVSLGTPDSFYRNNTLAAGSEPLTYLVAGDLNDLQIEANVISEALPAAFAAGVGNLIQGNAIDPGAMCTPLYPTDVPTSCSCSAP